MEGEAACDFFCLPQELQLHIIQKLPLKELGRVAGVCSQWKALAYDKSGSHYMYRASTDFWRTRKELSDAFPNIIERVHNEVVELNVAYCADNINPTALYSIGKCRELRWLSLAWCRYGDPLVLCQSASPFLITASSQVNDEVLDQVSQNCTHLTHLDLRGCAQLSGKAMLECLPRLINLESLVLDFCVMNNPLEFTNLAARCTSLQRLSTFFLRFKEHPFSVWDDYSQFFMPAYGRLSSKLQRRIDKGSTAVVLDRLTLETDLWKKAYIQSFNLKTDPQIQIAAAVEQARKQDKLVLLCIGLCRAYKVEKDWSIRMEHYLTHNPLIWKRLNEVFVWLHLDEAVSRDEGEPMGYEPAIPTIEEGDVEDWKAVINNLPEWPYLFILDSNGRLVSRQTTGPLERYERYDHETVLRFISQWQHYLRTGLKPGRIEGLFEDPEPAYCDLSGGEYQIVWGIDDGSEDEDEDEDEGEQEE